ncbi:MAG: spore maturation protein [Clostridia bacterium]|nr:spore maturation protein [Clostridia bacterium]MBQ9807176.1 spore maturation protein [Clostridia bacterium]
MIETLSALAMPLTVAAVGAILLFGKSTFFEAFVRGAREGLHTAVGLLPTLAALTVAVSMLNASGLISLLSRWLTPAANAIGLPADLLPLLLTRPFSGAASTAAYTDLLARVGADSFAGLCASVIYATSDTVVYVIAVYFSAVRVRSARSALPIAFSVMLFCIFFSCFLCRVWFF